MNRIQQGQVETDVFIWIAVVFTVIFFGIATFFFAFQNATENTVFDFLSPNPNTGNRITEETRIQSQLRASSILLPAVLDAPYDGSIVYSDDGTVRAKIRSYLYCTTTTGPPNGCSFSDFDAVMERYLPDRKFTVTARYQGESLSAERYGSRAYSGSPSTYQVYIPMPGGTNAAVELSIEGNAAVKRWVK